MSTRYPRNFPIPQGHICCRVVEFEYLESMSLWVLDHVKQGCDLILDGENRIYWVIVPGELWMEFIAIYGPYVSADP